MDKAPRFNISSLILLHLVVYLTIVALGGIHQIVKYPMGLVLMALLIWISVQDFLAYKIPNIASFLLLLSGLTHLIIWQPNTILSAILAGVIWPLIFWVLAAGYKKLRGRTGLGHGDVKLISGLAIWAGPEGSPIVILLGSVGGLLAFIGLFCSQGFKTEVLHHTPIAFGPFLCLATWIVWIS